MWRIGMKNGRTLPTHPPQQKTKQNHFLTSFLALRHLLPFLPLPFFPSSSSFLLLPSFLHILLFSSSSSSSHSSIGGGHCRGHGVVQHAAYPPGVGGWVGGWMKETERRRV